MLSIDEAIAHAREVANTQRGKSGICLQNGLECEHFSDCLKCAEEHEQLAEWLEELKALREEKSEFQIMAKDNYEMGMENGYKKAIDDFIHECDKYCGFYSGKNKSITREDILKIAEQLKAKKIMSEGVTENDKRIQTTRDII